MAEFTLKINGKLVRVTAPPDEPLLWVLRYRLDMTGTKYGCGEGQCGACTVLLDGHATRSCLTPVETAAGASITTVEGLEQEGKLTPVQEAFLREDAMQCGLLHRGDGDECHRAAEGRKIAKRPADCGGHERQCLPLRNLPANRGSGEAGVAAGGDWRRAMNSPYPSMNVWTEGFSEAIRAKGIERGALNPDRRDFLKGLGAGLLIAMVPAGTLAPAGAWAQESGRGGGWGGHALPKDLNAWIHVGADGQVKVFTGKVEVGQNIRTSLAQAVAEELRTPFDSVVMIMGDTDRCRGTWGTFGSRTTPTMNPQLRNMAVAARQMLIDMAASEWQVDASRLTAADGKVRGGKRRPVHFVRAELHPRREAGEGRRGRSAASPARVEDRGQRRPQSGRPGVRHRQTRFPSDIARPGNEIRNGAAAHRLQRHPRVSVDTSAAEKILGVTVVHDGDFIGVAAPEAIAPSKPCGNPRQSGGVPQQPGTKISSHT